MDEPEINGFSLYMRGVGKSNLLTRKEEIELCSLALFYWDERARQRLIESNLRFVHSIAKKFKRRGVPLLDFIQEGNVGLVEAVDSYNPLEGTRFSTYAIHKIKAKVRRAIARDGIKSIRPPFDVFPLIPSLRKYISWCDENEVSSARDDFYDSLDRELKTKITEKRFKDAVYFVRRIFSGNMNDHENINGSDYERDYRARNSVEAAASEEERRFFQDVVYGVEKGMLTDVQRDFLLKKYLMNMTYAQIAEEVGLTPQRAAQIVGSARKIVVRHLERRIRED